MLRDGPAVRRWQSYPRRIQTRPEGLQDPWPHRCNGDHWRSRPAFDVQLGAFRRHGDLHDIHRGEKPKRRADARALDRSARQRGKGNSMKDTVNIALAALSATRETVTISALVDNADEDRIGQL